MLSNQLLFFFSALGVFHGLLLWAYLLVASEKKKPTDYLLLTVLLLFCLRVGVSCVYFFEPRLAPHWIQLGLSANFLIGPALWLYVLGLLPERRGGLPPTAWAHLGVALLIVILLAIFYPFAAHFSSWDFHLRYLIHTHLTIYLLATAYLLWPSFWQRWRSETPWQPWQWRAVLVFLPSVAICACFVLSLYTSYILGPVLTSLIFYLLALGGFWGREHWRSLLQPGVKYAASPMPAEEARVLLSQLHRLMEEEKLYRDGELQLENLARQMKLSNNRLSQLVNESAGKNFSSFVNGYRIEAAKRLLRSKAALTVEAVAYEVGFSSKSAFYATFKKMTGQTPSAFRKSSQNTFEDS
ncbi:MAG: helix-turn-helix domain-containing protein [Bacteroidota bacterium]